MSAREDVRRDGRRRLARGPGRARPAGGARRRAQTPAEIQAALDAAYAKYKDLKEGKNADYIPALAKVDSNIYGIALVTTDGKVVHRGRRQVRGLDPVDLQGLHDGRRSSRSQGPDAIEKTIGVDATGMRFNSIVAVEFAQKALGGPEINPLVNPGAITATSMVKGASRDEVWKTILGFYSDFAGRPLSASTRRSSSRRPTPTSATRRIGYLMYAYGFIKANPLQATDVYTEQCSVSVNAKDLATMAATLANGGKNPVTGKQVMKAANVARRAGGDGDRGPLRRLGQVALPHRPARARAASAAASSPSRRASSASRSISPPLDDAGNSVQAQKAIADISNALGRTRWRPGRGRAGGDRAEEEAGMSGRAAMRAGGPGLVFAVASRRGRQAGTRRRRGTFTGAWSASGRRQTLAIEGGARPRSWSCRGRSSSRAVKGWAAASGARPSASTTARGTERGPLRLDRRAQGTVSSAG